MSPEQWERPEDAFKMILAATPNKHGRKLQLYLVACALLLEDLYPLRDSFHAIRTVSEHCEGRCTEEQRSEAEIKAESAVYAIGDDHYGDVLPGWFRDCPDGAAQAANWLQSWDRRTITPELTDLLELATYFASVTVSIRLMHPYPQLLAQFGHFLSASLLRDIFGNPFRPVAFSPDWRTATVVALAASMYESRDFGPMPVLADALEEAGCDSSDVLDHCRGPVPHVRGCWVVDLVLGKE